MIEIRYLQAESGANKFGTCNCCGKSSGEDPLMISIKFSYYGHGTLICLCDDCKKKLIEALPPANNSEIPNSSDTISRAKAIEALDKRFDSIPMEQTLEILMLRKDLRELPPAQPERIKGRWIYHPEWANDGECGYECSVCHMGSDIDYNFCMRCGADMRT